MERSFSLISVLDIIFSIRKMANINMLANMSHSQEGEWEPVTLSDEEEKNAVLNAPHSHSFPRTRYFEELYVIAGQF